MLTIKKENNSISGLLQELTLDETAQLTGGSNIRNDSNNPVTFYLLNPDTDPIKVGLKNGEGGSYNSPYIVYDSLGGNDYQPVLRALDANTDYTFSRSGNNINLDIASASLPPGNQNISATI